MIIVSYGVEKSGSTLAFEMTKVILELHGHPQDHLSELVDSSNINEVGPWSDERLARLIEASNGTRIAIRSHHRPSGLSSERVLELVQARELKIQVVFRDPRDTVVSMIDDGVRARALGEKRHSDLRTVDDAIPLLAHRLTALRQWGWFPALQLRYHDFAFDRSRGPRLIAEDLGLMVDPAEVWRLLQDRQTRRNAARLDRYQTELWPDEVQRVERAFPLYLDLVRGNECAGWFTRPG